MIESYYELGMDDLADATTRVLEVSYPEEAKDAPKKKKKRFIIF